MIRQNKSGFRILYFCHDNPSPAGGIKTIYQHVSHLNHNGFKAFVVHNQPGFRINWFSSDAPVIYVGDNLSLTPEDLIVIPEDYKNALDSVKDLPVNKYIFCQNHYYIFKSLPENCSWMDYGIRNVICSSKAIRDFVEYLQGYEDLPVIRYGFDKELFKPREKKLQVAYMSRKRPFELDFLRKSFRLRFPQYREIPWIDIHNRNEKEVAVILGESIFFLSMNLFEGFGMPPVEAMLSGCIVIGFHGGGGEEYALPETGIWCRENDLTQCVAELGKAVGQAMKNPAETYQRAQTARNFALYYSLENQGKDVIDFWGKEIKELTKTRTKEFPGIERKS